MSPNQLPKIWKIAQSGHTVQDREIVLNAKECELRMCERV